MIYPIFGIILPVLSIALAVYFYLKGKKKKIPTYSIFSLNVISSDNLTEKKLKPLTIIYGKDSEQVNDLTVSKIYIQNRGNTPIRKEDIPNNYPFCITLTKDCKVFDTKCETKPENSDANIYYDSENNNINISFSYLEKKAGFTVHIIHSCKDDRTIEVTGKVIGGKKLKKTISSEEIDEYGKRYEYNFDRLFFPLILLFFLLFILFSIFIGIDFIFNEGQLITKFEKFIEKYEYISYILFLFVLFGSMYIATLYGDKFIKWRDRKNAKKQEKRKHKSKYL